MNADQLGAFRTNMETAALAIRRAMLLLDTASEPCGHCGAVRHKVWSDQQLFTEASAIVRKLDRWRKYRIEDLQHRPDGAGTAPPANDPESRAARLAAIDNAKAGQ